MPDQPKIRSICHHRWIPHPWDHRYEWCALCHTARPRHAHRWQPLFPGAHAWRCVEEGCDLVSYEPPEGMGDTELPDKG